MKHLRARAWPAARAAVAPIALLVLATGCLNPQTLNQASGLYYPIAPGNQPYLAVRIINDTVADLKFDIVWDDGVNPNRRYAVRGAGAQTTDDNITDQDIRGVTPQGRETGILLDWPVLRVGIGSLNNSAAATIQAALPASNAYPATTVTVPFNQPALTSGLDYNRGDAIIFQLYGDLRSQAFINVQTSRIAAVTQMQLFARQNPFETNRYVLGLFDAGQLSATFGGLP